MHQTTQYNGQSTVAGQDIATGYTLRLSAHETTDWATRPSKIWPCSTLAGHRIRVDVDSNGLCNLTLDGEPDKGYIDATELAACIADHVRGPAKSLWPCWLTED